MPRAELRWPGRQSWPVPAAGAAIAPFTVTATQGGSVSAGMAFWLGVLTGQAASQPGQTAGATQVTPSLAITPNATGSLIYGSLLGLAGTYTALAASAPLRQDVAGGGLEYVSLTSTNKTTAATPVTVGATATANGISIVLCEILAAGTLAEDASTPGGTGYVAATAAASASFAPPHGSLLVALVQSNGGGSVTTMAVTDTSGLGLSWAEQAKQNGAGNGYAGVWTAAVP